MQGKECLLHNKHQKKKKESSEKILEERLFSSQSWEKKWVMGKREEAKRKALARSVFDVFLKHEKTFLSHFP